MSSPVSASRGSVTPPPPNRPRARLLVQSTVVMLAVTACCLFAGLIASRYPAYIDATSTRSHRLSPRTMQTLERLSGPTELIVTVNSAAIDARSAERTNDVLDALARASDSLKVTIADVASARGAGQLDEVWSRIAERSRGEIEAHAAALGRVLGAQAELALRLERLSGLLDEVDKSIGEDEKNARAIKRFLGDSAGFARLAAKDLADARAAAEDLVRTRIGRSPIPSFDLAASTLRRPLTNMGPQLAEIARNLDGAAKAGDDQLDSAVRVKLGPLGSEVGDLRDRVGRAEELLDALPRMALVNVARVLERSSTALVIGPPRAAGETGRELAAVDIESLFPADIGADGSQLRPDLRARTEELLGSALASLVNPAPPILVLLHGEDARFAPEFSRFALVFERLRLRGIDVVEWPVWRDKEQPNISRMNPRGDRPVVFATLYTIPNSPQDAARFVNLARVVEQLAADGRSMLMSVNPSTMPAIGQSDAMIEFLGPIGLNVDSGRPLMHQVGTPAAPVVMPETLTNTTDGTHPIARAISGHRVRLPWAIPLNPRADAPAAITPLITVANTGGTWAESQWLEFRSVPVQQRGFIRPQDQPRPDSQRDDAAGPWVVAAAIERKLGSGGGNTTQRLVVVGSNGWFLDEVAEVAEVVDNRRRALNPGNTELLEAAVYWLADQEIAIGASPQTEAAAVIPPLSAGTVSAIRWLLIGGLPVLVLLTGAVWRVIRG